MVPAHVLNLIIVDTPQCVVHFISFFDLLQKVAVFIKVLCKRMDFWIEKYKKRQKQKCEKIEINWTDKMVRKRNATRLYLGHLKQNVSLRSEIKV